MPGQRGPKGLPAKKPTELLANRPALLAAMQGRYAVISAAPYSVTAAIAEAAHEGRAILKVILETALLTDEEKVAACVAAKRARADFVKTSTGFSKGGATVHDVSLMAKAVDHALGVKASGGVGSAADVRKMVEAGATRIGASVGVKIVQEAKGLSPASSSKASAY